MPNPPVRHLAIFVLACLGFAAATTTSVARPPPLPPPQPDVTALLNLAQIKVINIPGFSHALLHSATGTVSGGGNATIAQNIDTWTFVYDNALTPHSTHPSAILTYTAHAFGPVTAGGGLGLGTTDIHPIPPMTLAHALQLLRKAGISEPFTSVALRAVPGPNGATPDYFFSLASGKSAFVDVKTGHVTPPVQIDPP